jgi:transcriptional regulator with XRE-family HTH domain
VSEETLFRPPTPIPRRSPQSGTLADLLHELMAYNGFVQKDLAQALGVATNTVNRHLHEASVPTEEFLRKVAEYAHLPITDVREMGGRSRGEDVPFTWPREFDQLSYRQKAALIETGRAMLDGNARRVTR